MEQCKQVNTSAINVIQIDNTTFCVTSHFGEKPLLDIMLPIAKERLKREIDLDNGQQSVYNNQWN